MGQGTVVVVGGGNAGLCAALAATEAGAKVTLVERAPRHLRGGNSRHTRNVRTAHLEADDFYTAAYPPEEFLADIRTLNVDALDPTLTDLLVTESQTLPGWMESHGANWQAPLRGTLHLSRTNRFFLGGGKTLVNAYYRTAEAAGVEVRYDANVVAIDIKGDHCVGLWVDSDGDVRRLACDALVLAAGGFEANLEWLAEYWGAAAANFMVRGTPFNDGAILRQMLGHGAQPVGDPTRFHAIAVDSRGPKFDGGIVTRLDTIPVGIVVNRAGQRFYDEGEDIWPKRYAQWGRLIAEQAGQVAYSILDARHRRDIMPPVYPPFEASTIEEVAGMIGLDATNLAATVAAFNAHVTVGVESNLAGLDGCATHDLVPPKSNWAVPIDQAPFLAFPLSPGITFTYFGLRVDAQTRVQREGGPFANVYAAGEIMAGNVLSRGYIAGIGMTIGSVFGRIAGQQAATHA